MSDFLSRRGKYSDAFSSGSTTSTGSRGLPATLVTARSTAQNRILSSPMMYRTGKYSSAFSRVNEIASGKNTRSNRGIWGTLGNVGGQFLRGVGYVAGTPVRAVASTAKEITDLAEGRGFSPKDFVKQIADEKFYPSTLVKKTGNKWLDGAIGLTVDIAGDPLTYVTFGASAWAGKSGRMLLAAKAAESATLAKAPSLAGKLDEIARLGVHADLTPLERQVLNAPKGMSWTFGSKGMIGREGTALRRAGEVAADVVGKPTSKIRAGIGDIKILQPVQSLTAGKGIRTAGLVNVGRRGSDMATNELISKLGGYSSSIRSRALGRAFTAKFGSKFQDFVKEASDWEAANGIKLSSLRENPNLARPAGSDELLQKMDDFFGEVRTAGNEALSDFSTRRGVRVYDIAHIDNYVPHTLSDDAVAWLASKRWRGTKFQSYIENSIDLTPGEFIAGPGVIRARKLAYSVDDAGMPIAKDWLGVQLVNPEDFTIDNINRITQEKLGFKWFADDVASYSNSYLDSVANQVRRVGFVDRMYDYGQDVIRNIDWKVVPDKDVVAAWKAGQSQFDKLLRIASSEAGAGSKLTPGIGRETAGLVGRASKVARRMVQNAGKAIFTEAQMTEMRAAATATRAALDEATKIAERKGVEVQQAFETAVAPLRSRLSAIETALSNSDQAELAATMFLEGEHVKMFPKAKNRPTNPQMMAEQIVGKSESRTVSKLKALETRRKRLLKSIGPTGRRTRAVARLQSEVLASNQELVRIGQEMDNLQSVVQRSTQDFPDGVVYIYGPHLEAAQAGQMSGIPVYRSLPPGAQAEDFVISFAPDLVAQELRILKPWESAEDFQAFLDYLPDGIGGAIARLDQQTAEEFASIADEILGLGGAYGAINPAFAEAEPQLAGILARLENMHSRSPQQLATLDPQEFSAMFDQDMEDIAMLLDDYLDANPGANAIYADGKDMLFDGMSGVSNPRNMTNYAGVDLGGFGSVIGTEVDTVMDADYLINSLEQVPDDVAAAVQRASFDPNGDLLAAQEQYGLTQSMGMTQQQELDAALADVAAAKQQATTTGKQIGGTRSAANRLQGRVNEATASIDQARNAIEIPGVAGEPTVVSRKQAESASRKTQAKIAQQEKEFAREFASDPVVQQVKTATDANSKATAAFDAAKAQRADAAEWEQTFGPSYREDLAALDELALSRPAKGASASEHLEWNRRAQKVLADLRNPEIISGPQREALERVILQTKGLEAQVAMWEQAAMFNETMLNKTLNGDFGGKLQAQIIDGWSNIEALGVRMPSELHDFLFSRVRDLSDIKEYSKFKQMYFAYHRFFKITAMLTPGFIVRNAMTAAFNNFVAGVTLAETREGIKFAKDVFRYGSDEALRRVPKELRDLYEQAYLVVMATGAGQTADDLLMPIVSGKANRFLESRPVKLWTKGNESVEMGARFSLALSSLRKDLGFDGSVAQVARYHFDYSELSKLDEFARQWVPFWIFATRNIPLQIVNQIARPSLYRAYDSLERNFGVPEDVILPQWIRDRRPLQGPGGSVVIPDLPFIDMREQVGMFADPMRLASQLNPAIKLPIELMGGRQLGLNIPFTKEPQQVRGPLDWPSALAGLPFGQTQRNAEGDIVMSTQAQYAAPNLLPQLAVLQRLIPQLGGKESYVDRQTSSALSTLGGIPLRFVSNQERENEIKRREFAMRDFLANLTRLGYLEPTN